MNHVSVTLLAIAATVAGFVLFSAPASGVPLQQFATSGAAEISVKQCYDTNAANVPVISAGRVVCSASNPATLAQNTTYTSWTVINLPVGNRLAVPTTFTPMDGGEWSSAPVPCGPVDANNRCSAAASTGVISLRTDVMCDQVIDALADSGSAGGNINLWPDVSLWTPPAFTRIAASPALGGNGPLLAADPDDYIHAQAPQPGTWDFVSSDLAQLTTLLVGGTTPFTIGGGLKLNHVAHASTYPGQTGLVATATLLGDSPDRPPDDDMSLCFSAPRDSITSMSFLTTPAADTIIPRWTLLESEPDLGDRTVSRILDWQCDVIGAGVPDADGDCDPDATDSDDANKDIDGDLVPDGVELAYNSSPTTADTDGDGADDYAEIFQFTDPQDPDSDNDGQADKQDVIPTNGPTVPAGNDLTHAQLNPDLYYDADDASDDNCPNEANPTQLNTDALWQYHGMGGNADPDGAGSFIGQNTSTGDRTNPDEDPWGDACDDDDDNDELTDAAEASLRIRPWSGFTDGGGDCIPEPTCSVSGDVADTTVCVSADVYPAAALPIRVMSPVMGDVDYDMVLDGRECQFRSRPDASCRNSAADAGCVSPPEALFCSGNFVTLATLASGCAQPAPSASGGSWPAASGATEVGLSATSCTNYLDDDGDTIINDGCPGLQNPGGGDVDADFLYMPGTASQHVGTETFFRTRNIITGLGSQVDDIDGDGQVGSADADSDRDFVNLGAPAFTPTSVYLRGGIEIRYYGTNPSMVDTDGDGCWDGDEITDLNGDGFQNIGDTGLRLQATGTSFDSSPANGRTDREFNHTPPNSTTVRVGKYALAANRDLSKDGIVNVSEFGMMAVAQSLPGACPPGGENGIALTPTNATKGLP